MDVKVDKMAEYEKVNTAKLEPGTEFFFKGGTRVNIICSHVSYTGDVKLVYYEQANPNHIFCKEGHYEVYVRVKNVKMPFEKLFQYNVGKQLYFQCKNKSLTDVFVMGKYPNRLGKVFNLRDSFEVHIKGFEKDWEVIIVEQDGPAEFKVKREV